MKYKAGDVVKLRDDLEDGKKYGTIRYAREMDFIKGKPMELIAKSTVFGNCYITKDENDVEWYISDEMKEGLWEECKPKLKLIDIINKIANGELKEGTKVNLIADDYLKKLYYDGELIRFVASDNIYAFTPKDINDEDEYELIEPNHFADAGGMTEPTECEHEWKIGRIRDTIDPLQVVAFQRCEKCGMTKIIEEIEEIDYVKWAMATKDVKLQILMDKIKELTQKVNAQTTVLLSQGREIKEIKEQ